MDEPNLIHHGDLHASVLPILDRHGAPSRVVIVKGTYRIVPGGGPLTVAPEQHEVRMGDELWGEPDVADIRLPGDFCAAKPGTDVVLCGHAVPTEGSTATEMDVSIQVADRTLILRVHGERQWRRGLMSVVPGPAQVLGRTPLSWSRAFGGQDLTDPTRPLEEERNPVGSGVARDTDRLIGTPAPQIERPDAPVGSAGDRHEPAGCAPLGRHFAPRRAAAGTFDGAWLKSVYPARPSDYREEHERFAPAELSFDTPLRGGEAVVVRGVHAMPLAFKLPKWQVVVAAAIDGAVQEQRPHLDTVVIDSDSLRVELLWRALFRCPAKMNRFTAVHVAEKEFIG